MNRWRRLGFATGLAITHAGCGPGLRATVPYDVDVYRAVLASTPSRLVQSTTQPPLEFSGKSADRIALLAGQLHPLDASTVRSFLARNRDSVRLPNLEDPTVVWIAAEEWRALANQPGGWEEIRGRAPGSNAVVTISRPGYSRDASLALVYVIAVCEGLCSESHYVLLSRDGGEWKVVARAQDWVS
jgi:hypothetical protein